MVPGADRRGRLKVLMVRRNGRPALDAGPLARTARWRRHSGVLHARHMVDDPAFAAFGALWGGSGDARWHENGHGTAFRSRWANDAMYNLASFMMLREPTLWRWSHVRHHSNTLIVGLDPEIGVPRPPPLFAIALNYLNLINGPKMFGKIVMHAFGISRTSPAYSCQPTSCAASCGRLASSSYCWSEPSSPRWNSDHRAAALRGSAFVLTARGSCGSLPSPARGTARRRARPPNEHPDGLHQPGLPLPLPEHELPR